MTLTILATFMDLFALGWSVYLVWRHRDWRLGFLALILGVFVVREAITLLPLLQTGMPFRGTGELRLTAALSAILVVFAIDRLFAERSVVFESLHRSQNRYQTLVETIPYGILEIDRDGTVTYCNAAVERLLGYRAVELIGKPVWAFCRTSYEIEEFRRYLQRLILEKTSSMQHFVSFKCGDGTHMELQTDWNYRRSDMGDLDGLVGIVTDVTARKQTERALRLIVQGTSSTTGVDFFRSLVRHLADALQVRIAFVAELVQESPPQSRFLALWTGERFEEKPPFDVIGSIHEEILDQSFVSVAHGVANKYANDEWLQKHSVDCYMALPLFDSGNKIVGFMGVMHDSRIRGWSLAESILRVFAVRAAVELQREQAEEAVRVSEAKLHTIVQEMPVMMCAVDTDDNIVAWNRECEAVTEFKPEEIIGKPDSMLKLFPEVDGCQVTRGWASAGDDFRSRESIMTTKSGQRKLVEWSRPSKRVPIKGWASWGIGIDVTDRLLAEEHRRHSEDKIRAVLDAIPDVMLQIDQDRRCTDFKCSSSSLTLFQVENVIGHHLEEILPAEIAERMEQSIIQADKSTEIQGFEFQARHEGSGRAYEVRIVRTNLGQYLCIFRDVTERVRLQKEILEISSREQRRIGQDLHDGLGQLLTAIAFLAQALQQRLSETAVHESDSAEQIVKLIYDAIAKTRGVARGLCPIQIEENGLVSALQDLADDVETLYGIRCDYECSENLAIEDNIVATNLFRIAQESVNNALKHGEAKHLRLALTSQNGDGLLSVTDNGLGFATDPGSSKGLGFSIMKYRATMIGGVLEVRAGADGGTTVRCSFPLNTGKK